MGGTSAKGRLKYFTKEPGGIFVLVSGIKVIQKVACNQQVCGRAASPSGDVTFTHSPRKIVMDDVQCRGNEKYLWECSHKGWCREKCGSHHDASAAGSCTR